MIPVAIETSGACDPQSHSFLADLGCHHVHATGDHNASQYLWQQLSIATQRDSLAVMDITMTSLLTPVIWGESRQVVGGAALFEGAVQ